MASPVEEALADLDRHRVVSVAGASSPERNFIPLQPLIELFDINRVRHILQALRVQHDWHPRPRQIVDSYLRVFLILLRMDQAQHITRFTSSPELADKRLPFESKPNEFPSEVSWDRFYKSQRPFSASDFTYGHSDYQPEVILPIVKSESIASGGSGAILRIELHPAFDGLPHASGNNGPHIYARKIFLGDDAKRYFDAEVDAYDKITAGGQPIDSLARFYCSFTYEGTYNIILEYANSGSWQDFLRKRPPIEATDRLAVWKAVLGLGYALHRIHEADCWHQDINPSNIVVSHKHDPNSFNVSLKLVDLGRSCLNSSSGSDPNALAGDNYGTKDYGAPECCRISDYNQSTRRKVSRKVDVWSMGCVWLETAVWIAEGPEGVSRFRDDRIDEAGPLGLEEGVAFFHRGQHDDHRLQCVDRMIEDIPLRLDDSGGIARDVQVLVKDMLHRDYRHRPSAETVTGKVDKLNAKIDNILDSLQISNHGVYSVQPHPLTDERRNTAPEPARSSGDLGDRALHRQLANISMTDGDNLSSFSRPEAAEPSERQFFRPGHQVYTLDSLSDAGGTEPLSSNATMTAAEGSHGSIARYGQHHKFQGPVSGPQRAVSNNLSHHSASRRSTGNNRDFAASHTPPSRTSTGPRHVRKLSVTAASEWKHQNEMSRGRVPIPVGNELMTELNNRDHAFIVDNSFSTQRHWGEMCYLLRLLSYMVEGCDPDGIELRFTASTNSIRSHDSDELHRVATNTRPAENSNVETALERTIERMDLKLSRQSQQTGSVDAVRPLSIYVLTDGKWDTGNPEVVFLGLIETLKQYRLTRRQVGIQFISFGNDQEGLERMESLDVMNGRMELNEDIVDTEPANGNVWKMLLGAILPEFDGDRPASAQSPC